MADLATSPFSVDVWSRAISIDYLAARHDWTGVDCDIVAESLADFAPAVRIVDAVASETGWSPEAAVERIRAARGGEPDRIAASARAAIEIVSWRLAETAGASVSDWHLLSLATLAYLPPSIPLSLLPAAALTLDSPALGPFFKLGILKATNGAVHFDPVLQHAMRKRMRDMSNNFGYIVAFTAVDRVVAQDPIAPRSPVDAVLGHAAAESAGSLPQSTLAAAANLGMRNAEYRQAHGESAEARAMSLLALTLQHRLSDSADDEIGLAYGRLGDRLKKRGDLDGAREAYLRSIDIAESCYGPEHAKVGLRLARLGGLLRKLKHYAAAKNAYERSIRIGESTLASGDIAPAEFETPAITTVFLDVFGDQTGELISDLNGYALALESGQEPIPKDSRIGRLVDTLTEDGYAVEMDVADEVTDLLFSYMIILKRDGNLRDARRVLERTIAIRERLPDSIEHKLGRTLAAYAILLRQIGDMDALRPVAERLRALRPAQDGTIPGPPPANTVNGTTRPDILAARYENLGIARRELGELQGACHAFERAVDLTKRPCKELAVRFDQLASTLRRIGSLERSCATYERAVTIGDRVDPLGVAQSGRLDQLAAVRKQTGRIDRAIDALWKAVSIDEDAGRTNTKAGSIHLNNLARTLEDAGDLGQAEAVFERAIRAASYDSRDLPLRIVLTNFALLHRRKGNLDDAAWYAKRAVDLDKTSGHGPDAGVANRLANWAVILFDRGDYLQSADAFEDAHAIRVEIFGEEDAIAKNLMDSLKKARAKSGARVVTS